MSFPPSVSNDVLSLDEQEMILGPEEEDAS